MSMAAALSGTKKIGTIFLEDAAFLHRFYKFFVYNKLKRKT